VVVRDNIRLIGSMFYWDALAGLDHEVVTGDVALKVATGRSFFEHLGDHPGDAAVFNAAMDALSTTNIPRSSLLTTSRPSGVSST
jgi:hypothetical protein